MQEGTDGSGLTPSGEAARQREMKFRIWRDGVMYRKNVMSWEGLGDYLLGVDWAVAMQWTGLKDKHGREIYEGDILKSLPGKPCVVRFCDGEFEAHGGQIRIDRYSWREREIIGNIYENPDLLASPAKPEQKKEGNPQVTAGEERKIG